MMIKNYEVYLRIRDDERTCMEAEDVQVAMLNGAQWNLAMIGVQSGIPI